MVFIAVTYLWVLLIFTFANIWKNWYCKQKANSKINIQMCLYKRQHFSTLFDLPLTLSCLLCHINLLRSFKNCSFKAIKNLLKCDWSCLKLSWKNVMFTPNFLTYIFLWLCSLTSGFTLFISLQWWYSVCLSCENCCVTFICW